MSYCAVYLNRIYRERNCPEKPEDPLVLEKDIPYDADFSFIDFVPSVLTYSSDAHVVQYHRFSHLIDTANSWIRRNFQWKLVNCETVKLSYRHNLTSMVSRWEQQINPVTNLWNNQTRGCEFETALKVLRLWIRRKENDEDELDSMNENGQFAMALKFLDFIPQRLNGNVFETIDDLLVKVNTRLQQIDASRWNVITLESLKVESNSDWFIDTEVSLAEESSRHITILRLFYEEYSHNNSELWPMNNQVITVGIEDFKPRHLSGGSFFKKPQFESFSSLVHRATNWLASQSNISFMNAQSIDIKVKSLSKIETRICTHIEHGDYIQTLRLIYFKSTPKLFEQATTSQRPRSTQSIHRSQSTSQPLRLGSKVILTTKFEHPLDSLQQRIHNWIHNEAGEDAWVLSAETVDIYAKDDDERNLERASEECFQCNRLGSLNAYAFTAIRLFYCSVPDDELNGSDRTKSLSSIHINSTRSGQIGPKVICRTSSSQRRRQAQIANSDKLPSNSNRKSPKLKHQTTIETVPSLRHSQSVRRQTNDFKEFEEEALDFVKNFEELQTKSRSMSCCCM